LSASTAEKSYTSGARILAIGIGVTGLVTYAYFALASHALSDDDYGRISLLWSAIFITVSVLYRPVEQLLSRTIADREARGLTGSHHLRVAATIQLALGVVFVIGALIFRGPLQDDLLGGSQTLYWILIVSVLAYAASYFARGYLAGHRWFTLYGLLVFFEACARVMFAVLAVVGVASGESFVAMGMAAAPIVSLAVVPWALTRHVRATSDVSAEAASELASELDSATADEPTAEAEFTLAHGAGFAGAVLMIMIAEQTFLNAGPLLLKATTDVGGVALAGFAFNVLLIARAPLQLFQAIQTSILPSLTKAHAGGQKEEFRRAINITLAAIAGFAACVSLAMLALGPWLMDLFFGSEFDYDRGGLVLVSIGMGLYLAAATLNQASLARGRAPQAAACWLGAALVFVVVLVGWEWDDRILQVEVAYLSGALLLCGLLYGLYRAGSRSAPGR
jgi:O-antigen/teichoic acid export membrane protein